ncbi:TetR/AcrR family transcriptional regulator [Mycobacterium sp. pV006]|uniref:TetR/AcrR family transcriptional regulator n=1 Tax=Mycobacterium sp. pV006 TaxID=3238983 RepID=UPI00351AF2E8
MMSIRNSDSSVEERILAAAADCVLTHGVERVTMTEIARRARVSRPTIYRRWSDVRFVLAELLTTRIAGVLDEVPETGASREATVARVIAVARHVRSDDVVMAVIRDAPTIAMTYIADRLGTSQQILIDALAGAIEAGQRDGSVRCGDPQGMAAMCLLITQSTIQSAQMVDHLLDADALDAELQRALSGYLKP